MEKYQIRPIRSSHFVVQLDMADGWPTQPQKVVKNMLKRTSWDDPRDAQNAYVSQNDWYSLRSMYKKYLHPGRLT